MFPASVIAGSSRRIGVLVFISEAMARVTRAIETPGDKPRDGALEGTSNCFDGEDARLRGAGLLVSVFLLGG